MTTASSFPLVRGKKIRVTSLDNCFALTDPTCAGFNTPPDPPPAPQPPAWCTACVAPNIPIQYVVTSGIISVALTATIDEGDEVNVKNMDGNTCVIDKPCPLFQGYTIEFTFCQVQPCLWSMLTGQSVVLDANPVVADQKPIGLTMNSRADVCKNPFALELWAGVPAAACGPGAGGPGSYGYLLLPSVQPGVIGDFTVENGAITFSVTGAVTKEGNSWGRGPYLASDGDPTQSPIPPAQLPIQPAPGPVGLDTEDHLYLAYTHQTPPNDTDGCHHVCYTPGTPIVGGPGTAGGPVAGAP